MMIAFFLLGVVVARGHTEAFDAWVLESLRTGDDLTQLKGPAWVAKWALELTNLGGTSVAVLLIILTLVGLLIAGRFARAAAVGLAMIGGALWVKYLKLFYGRERPDEVGHLMEESTLSFPSGHSSVSAMLYLTLGLLIAQLCNARRFKAFYVVTGILMFVIVGFTRMALGVHYPTDVLGGWLLGGSWALFIWAVYHFFALRLDQADAAGQKAIDDAVEHSAYRRARPPGQPPADA
jgi:undecaprenyl-diphosphatase